MAALAFIKLITHYHVFQIIHGFLQFNPFQLSISFHRETNNLFCSANQITCFFMKYNTGLKWDNPLHATFLFLYPMETSENLCLKKVKQERFQKQSQLIVRITTI